MSKKRPLPDALAFRCPTCHAGVGEPCFTPDGKGVLYPPHARREAKIPRKKGKGSVHATPTAFESNRRRH
jgi:hypothetical protein